VMRSILKPFDHENGAGKEKSGLMLGGKKSCREPLIREGKEESIDPLLGGKPWNRALAFL